MPRPAIILWDIMETLVTEPFYDAMPAFFQMTLDELLQVKHPTTWLEFEKGEIDETEHFRRFFRDGRPIDGPGLRQCVLRGYRWIEGMQPLVAELHERGYPMHALSNYPIWYELIEQRLCLSRYLHWTFVSCHTGVRKPDADAFLGAARALEVEPDQCLFIDDRAVNVEAARRLNMDTILKRDADQVRSELVARGLLDGRQNGSTP